MSVILISLGPQAQTRLTALMPSLPVDAALKQHHGSEFSIATDGDISCSQGVVLALEGFVTHTQMRGETLGQALIGDFIQLGENCVKQWRGSFRIMIHHGGVTRIYSDQLASRALFYTNEVYTNNARGPLYSSHTAPLLKALEKPTIDGANLLQFLHAGRFFAGASLFKELRQLDPGSCHRIKDQGLSQCFNSPDVFSWYEYRLQNLALQADAVLPELKTRLDSAILQHWQRADTPALLLSGGVDSRYILNTLGELLPPAEFGQLLTCLWGEPNADSSSDASWAAREAARHKVPFAFYANQAPIENLFDVLFATQSGMTAHIFSHTDDHLWCRHLAQQGFHSLLRGDECFGPNGQEVHTREEALAKVGLSHLPHVIKGFDIDISDWQHAHAQHIKNLSQIADEPNDVRDLLYCRERLPSLNAHLNSQRAPFVENFNPMLDPHILDLNCQLPRHLRTDKRILRQCFARYYPTDGFATSGNGFNWQRLWHQPGLMAFVQRKLAELPAPFDVAYWLQVGQSDQIKLMQTAIRAIVVGQWLQGNHL